MDGERDPGKISQAYQDHLPYLVDLAFRMVGDIGAAEDIAQDAFSRLIRADLGEIEDERGWLIVVTSRLCLDQIKSARSRREHVHDSSEIEFVSPPSQPALADPADRVTFDDGVRLALLVMLQRLTAWCAISTGACWPGGLAGGWLPLGGAVGDQAGDGGVGFVEVLAASEEPLESAPLLVLGVRVLDADPFR
jgi:Sigma-70 region 2